MPVITIIGLQLGAIIAFSLVTETVFQWPGMGLLLVQSIDVADIPVMSAYLMLIALVFVTINLVVDLLYFAVDPRLRMPPGDGAMSDAARSKSGRQCRDGTLGRRNVLDSDLAYSFRHSPMAVVSALVAFVCVAAAWGAPWIAPHNPFDLASST